MGNYGQASQVTVRSEMTPWVASRIRTSGFVIMVGAEA
jgi:hypothetical protein